LRDGIELCCGPWQTASRNLRRRRSTRSSLSSPASSLNANAIADLALNHRIPTMLGNLLFVQALGFMASGLVWEDLFRRATGYVTVF
jgi:hypothetical protein